MEIIMDNIKRLRDLSGAGMADCRNALIKADNDIDKAISILRKEGIDKAAKRDDREAGEGIILVNVNNEAKEGYIVEINAETDFVVRSEKFQEFSKKILNIAEARKTDSLEVLLSAPMEDGNSVADNLKNLSAVIGEKLGIKRYAVLASAGTIGAYAHGGGKIGVLAALDKNGENELAHNIAMHIAAANPKYIIPDDVPAEEIAKEEDIYRQQLKKEGKPDNIIKKILVGGINKYYGEVCLVKQEYVKDDKKKVEDVLGGVKVEKFIRYSL
ncbi:elongation factor Ts [Candidatus Falkowbacteria bacterium CG_4_9_14_3_um_filter_36_9]|uniref:Elongation factor Ts n=2 Tax=Candidatus Falkowiibacteriota TaxID=1752728 RepID=A0A1J4T617_9BACT|nr:MAG: translation elongation factor Ts [Candidatus Falkowbacteria bacterium CG1_02_37_44]PIV50296.1 MAG: elongation factor Ts [Candidatus Falkowbacteria bacterium CG02_land_8_20_14_3_00_36_14]PIX11752.1 MAG: elongation factor Ts [Candidatus Falkowbacteria bacterium CG_4_8_14_3_um_filter_36_11]PJA10798.1 MAG: elongation factor Ts [Candidatus Falkowbacteria bacterium CG_4_10_14_0_2_um_filter_36_22]PJB19143.1 MAG: elongation factor Ts [Candidatus Falkowbacteria bacterium CG_4_9_14_3_um_filter_36